MFVVTCREGYLIVVIIKITIIAIVSFALDENNNIKKK